MIFGAHVSTAGGISNAVLNAERLGISAMQIFPWSPRMWQTTNFNPEEIEKFNSLYKAKGMTHTLIHMIYLANLAANNPHIYEQSVAALMATCDLAKLIDAYGIVLHLGSNANKIEGIKKFGDALKKAHKKLAGTDTIILLETSAGGGSNLGNNFAEIKQLIDSGGGDEHLGVLVDTCHTFAAGYDWRTDSGVKQIMTEIKNTVGVERIKAFHLNDSKFELSKGRDRHENIGQGHIGSGGFKKLFALKEFKNIPGVLETPGMHEQGSDLENIAALRKLAI